MVFLANDLYTDLVDGVACVLSVLRHSRLEIAGVHCSVHLGHLALVPSFLAVSPLYSASQ